MPKVLFVENSQLRSALWLTSSEGPKWTGKGEGSGIHFDDARKINEFFYNLREGIFTDIGRVEEEMSRQSIVRLLNSNTVFKKEFDLETLLDEICQAKFGYKRSYNISDFRSSLDAARWLTSGKGPKWTGKEKGSGIHFDDARKINEFFYNLREGTFTDIGSVEEEMSRRSTVRLLNSNTVFKKEFDLSALLEDIKKSYGFDKTRHSPKLW